MALLPATVLGWLPGNPLDLAAPDAAARAAELGGLLALLHQHAAQWVPPAGFRRPRYDAGPFTATAAQLAAAVELNLITVAEHEVIERTLGAAAAVMAPLVAQPMQWGLIHHDLHPANCLVGAAGLAPINFGQCGWGFWMADLATALNSLPVALRTALVQGYQQHRTLPLGAVRQLEACLIATRMHYYTTILDDASEHAWLRARLPQVVATVCERFLAGAPFLFELR